MLRVLGDSNPDQKLRFHALKLFKSASSPHDDRLSALKEVQDTDPFHSLQTSMTSTVMQHTCVDHANGGENLILAILAVLLFLRL